MNNVFLLRPQRQVPEGKSICDYAATGSHDHAAPEETLNQQMSLLLAGHERGNRYQEPLHSYGEMEGHGIGTT